MDAILFPGRLRPQGTRIASVGSRIEAIKNKKSIKKKSFPKCELVHSGVHRNVFTVHRSFDKQ